MFNNSLLRGAAKTCRITTNPNELWILFSQLSFPVVYDSYRLRIHRKVAQKLDKI
jgi:hypothetical protein